MFSSAHKKRSATKLALSIAVCTVLLSGCQPKSKPEDAEARQNAASEVQAQVLALEGSAVRVNVNMPDCSGNNCPEFVVERLQSNFPWIDQRIDQEILKNLKQILDISKINQSEQAASTPAINPSKSDNTAASSEPVSDQQKMQQQIEPYAQSFVELDKELKALSANHQINIMIKPSILKSQEPIATVVLNTSSYLGGAHGSSAQQYYNFDLKQQKQIQLDHLLLPNQKKSLESKAHEAFKAWVMDAKLADNVDDYEQAWKFKLSDNFLLGEQGLILQYGEYEIGPYSAGLPRLVIPYAQLSGILKAEYLPDTQAASEPVVNTPKQKPQS
ncbi:RsiV family protein [Acinetobacter sp. Marseille-P8049]|uniref:RsiV family protein n=1 Tax=Acinetobacter ihumii TaxID=2483802 RepID=UPI001030667B